MRGRRCSHTWARTQHDEHERGRGTASWCFVLWSLKPPLKCIKHNREECCLRGKSACDNVYVVQERFTEMGSQPARLITRQGTWRNPPLDPSTHLGSKKPLQRPSARWYNIEKLHAYKVVHALSSAHDGITSRVRAMESRDEKRDEAKCHAWGGVRRGKQANRAN